MIFDGNDLANFLIASKICQEKPYNADSVARATVQQFLNDIGADTIVATSSVEAIYDAPREGIVWLDTPYYSISAVYSSYDPSTGVGSLNTENTDYSLEPHGSGSPIDRIKFVKGGFAVGNNSQSVKVVGIPGLMLETDSRLDDITDCLLKKASLRLLPQLTRTDGPVKKLKQGLVEIEYDSSAQSARSLQWQAEYADLVGRYRRIVT